MANPCAYRIHIRGTKKAVLMLASVLPAYDYKEIDFEGGSDEE